MRELVQTIHEGRQWSWSVVGILALVLLLLIRSLLLSNILHAMKVRDSDWYRRTLYFYEKKSIGGWICFGIALIGLMLYWRFELFFRRYQSPVNWAFIFSGFYVISLFWHLHAYAKAIVETVSENLSTDKDI